MRFVDKTGLLEKLLPLVELEEDRSGEKGPDQGKGQKYVCITRPRRFGKTVMANMISSYFGKGIDSSKIFGQLKVAGHARFRAHLNKHDVIHIMFDEVPKNCVSEYTRICIYIHGAEDKG